MPGHIHLRMRRAGMPGLAGTALAGVADGLYAVEEILPAGEVLLHRPLADCAMHLTLAGEAEATVDGVVHVHRPGTLFAVVPGVEMVESVRRAWRVRYIVFQGSWGARLRAALAPGGGARLFERPPRPWRDALDSAVSAAIEQPAGWDWAVAADLARLLGGIAGPEEAGDGDLVARAARLIDSAPERPWAVPALARALGLPPRTLQQRFGELAGSGPARWVLARRLAHARPLLARGMPVHAVADRLGFANQFHFSRAFRRIHGVPPTQAGDRPG